MKITTSLIITPKVVIKAPSVLCIYNEKYIVNTLNFISELYTSAMNERVTSVKIDFTNTEQITAAAAVMLFAHINHLQTLKGNAGFFTFDTKNSLIHNAIFIRGQLLKTLMAGSRKKLIELEDNLSLFQYGRVPVEKRKVNRKLLEIIYRELSIKYKNATILRNFLSQLEDGIDEDAEWWQGLWYSQKNNQITFILYDLGIGIVESFSRNKTSSNILFPETDPKIEILREALRPGSSRFSSIGRGFGSVDILKVSSISPAATMIHSRDVRYTKNNSEERYELSYDIKGTLLEWDLDLPDEEDAQ